MVMSNRAAPEGQGKALGKGLGNLLGGDRVAGAASEPVKTPQFGRGMETLLGSSEKKLPETQTKPARTKALLPAWFYFTADFLLLAFCSAVLFHAPRPFEVSDLVFCAVTVGVACFFGLAGLAQSLGEGE